MNGDASSKQSRKRDNPSASIRASVYLCCLYYVYQFIRSSASLSVCFCLFVCLFICLFVRSFIRSLVRSSVRPFVSSVGLFVRSFLRPFVRWSIIRLAIQNERRGAAMIDRLLAGTKVLTLLLVASLSRSGHFLLFLVGGSCASCESSSVSSLSVTRDVPLLLSSSLVMRESFVSSLAPTTA